METVGIFLKKEREAHNISLSELARITKITPIYLELIEKDEFDKIPQGPYIKGYLSSYSRAVGCDVDKTIKLYAAANGERPQAEPVPPETASINTREKAADEPETARPTPSSRLQLGKLKPRIHSILSAAVARAASMKAAATSIGATYLAKMKHTKPSRHLAGRENLARLSAILNRWSTGRRTWIYAGIGLFGVVILFFAGTGFYHLFLYTPESAPVVEAETTQGKEAPQLSSVDPRPSASSSPSSSTSASNGTPKGYFTENRPPEPAGSEPVVPDAKPEAEGASRSAGPVKENGRSSTENALTAQQAPAHRDSASAKSQGASDQPSIKSDPSPKPTIADASLRVLKSAVSRTIENRMPAGVDRSFLTSDEKIFVWTQIEARQVPTKIRHVYYLGGKRISDVALDVRSSNWRTWSSKTIADGRQRGEWRVDIATSEGEVLRRLYFEVK